MRSRDCCSKPGSQLPRRISLLSKSTSHQLSLIDLHKIRISKLRFSFYNSQSPYSLVLTFPLFLGHFVDARSACDKCDNK